MRVKGNAFLVFITLVSVVLVTILQTLPPSPLPTNAPATQFSAERAIEHIRVIAKRPHPTGSVANGAVRDYILAQLKDLGLETETQREGDLQNVLGKIAGTHSSDAVMLTAHLDSVAESPGASDDGSGAALVSYPPPVPITDGSFGNWPRRIHFSRAARPSALWQNRVRISATPSDLPGSPRMPLICIGTDAYTRRQIRSKTSTHAAFSIKATIGRPQGTQRGVFQRFATVYGILFIDLGRTIVNQ